MKFIHLSDLHIGKRVNGFSMMEDQEYILNEIINIIDNEEPQAVILAGDIYDKAIPQADAVELLDDFLVKLSERRLQVFVISGNHDSPERLAFGRRLMEDSGIYVAPVYDGNVKPFTVKDDYGEVNIFLLPFIKPVHVRKAFPQQVHEIESYNDAVRVAIENMDIHSSICKIFSVLFLILRKKNTNHRILTVGKSILFFNIYWYHIIFFRKIFHNTSTMFSLIRIIFFIFVHNTYIVQFIFCIILIHSCFYFSYNTST